MPCAEHEALNSPMTHSPPRYESIKGTVLRITFWNPEDGYFVAAVEAPGNKEITVSGRAPRLTVGESLHAEGRWDVSERYGRQFKATAVTLAAPSERRAMARYLAHSVEGVGEKFAEKLIDFFGKDVFNVIEQTPQRLTEVPGVGKKRAAAVIAAYASQKEDRDAMCALYKSGIGPAQAKKIFAKHGDKTASIIKTDPYSLIETVRSVGFQSADRIALSNGIDKDSEFRLRAGVKHVLALAEGGGSCGLPLQDTEVGGKLKPGLITRASELLEADPLAVEKAVDLEALAGTIICEADGNGVKCAFRKKIYIAEHDIAERLSVMLRRPLHRPLNGIDDAILDAELATRLRLEESQRAAVRLALSSQVCVLTGGPGCGKTTTTKVLLAALQAAGFRIALAAPTGKAANRAEQATGVPAATIHRTFGAGPKGWEYNENKPLAADVLVVDEASMLDVDIMARMLRALSPHSRLVLVGDCDQLDSVGPGKVLADFIDSGVVPVARLTHVFRQAADSAIIQAAHAIRQGQMPLCPPRDSDFIFLRRHAVDRNDDVEKANVRQAIKDEIVRIARNIHLKGFHPVQDLQVYAPMKKGVLGVESLNLALRDALNGGPSQYLDCYGARLGVGDKVMQLRNNAQLNVFNGSVGLVESVDPTVRRLVARMDGEAVAYDGEALEDLSLAYAMSIHKSQGSETPVALIALDNSHWQMLARKLLYTGVTRAKKLCVIIGDEQALERAVRHNPTIERHSRLKRLLAEKIPALRR